MSLRACVIGSTVTWMSASRQAFLFQLQGQPGQTQWTSQLQTTMEDFFKAKKTQELDGVEEVALRELARAIAMGNAYGLNDVATVREARDRFVQLRVYAGEYRTTQFLSAVTDPMDPRHRRRLGAYPWLVEARP
jgi:hypothetical protein